MKKLEKNEKKIYRSRRELILAGVAGGLAEYFGVDPTLVRILFVLLALSGGGVLVYIVLMLIVPQESEEETIKGEEKIKEDNGKGGRKTLGMVLLAIGVVAIWNQIMPMSIRWEWVGAAGLVAAGLYLMTK